ncbi:hypothetical protein LTR17_026972 [Elasticomyces elasticus]|nr:hypothetical protein LTR17_026972 [Elasticomyces elasticus]
MQPLNTTLKYAARDVRRHLGRPVHLVLDWDGTMTTNDTMAVLGDLPRSTFFRRLYESREGTEPSGEVDEQNGLERPVQLVFDRDGTMTTKDTMAALGELPKSAYLRKLHESREGDEENRSGRPIEIPKGTFPRHEVIAAHRDDQISKADTHCLNGYPGSQWSDLGAAYMKDYHAHKALHYPKSDHHESRERLEPSREGDEENESGRPIKPLKRTSRHGDDPLSKTDTHRLDAYPGSQWSDLGGAYMNDYHAHKAAHYPKSDPSDHNDYIKWLDSLRPIEYASAQRAMDTEHFRGVRSSDVEAHAKEAIEAAKVTLREGCITLLLMFVPDGTDYVPPAGSKVSIISVNWSESFIRWALYHYHSVVLGSSRFNDAERCNLLNYISNMEIHTNEIHGLDHPQGSSGRLNGCIRTAREKCHYLPPARKYCQEPLRDEQDLPLVVYVGDSGTDYECLRNADVGIWLHDCRDESVKDRFRETFQPLNMMEATPSHVSKAKTMDHCGGETWCLWARSLADVGDYLEQLGEPQATA